MSNENKIFYEFSIRHPISSTMLWIYKKDFEICEWECDMLNGQPGEPFYCESKHNLCKQICYLKWLDNAKPHIANIMYNDDKCENKQ